MKTIQLELERVRGEIERLRAQEDILVSLLRKMSGEIEAPSVPKKRASSVKPHVLDIMKEVGTKGATSSLVDELVRARIPTVAKDTVGSVLSRLKADGALVYDGERYYDKQFAPKGPFEGVLRAVN